MPDVNSVSPGAVGARVDLSAAPAADQDWDVLFPNPELTASQPQPAQGTNSTVTPQATQPFLKAGETVYNTAEDAVNGTIHKDRLIATYRSFLAQNGVDPNTMQKTAQAQPVAQQQQTTQSPYKYYGNPKFFDEVAAAATARDGVTYTRLFDEYAREAINANLEPWRPTLAETNRAKAIHQVKREITGFEEFYYGDGHKQIIEANPLFKEMEQIGENDPTAAQRLPEVFRAEYLMWQGLQRNQNQTTTTVTPQNTPTVRQQPTLQSSSLTPPPPAVNTSGWSQTNWQGNKSLGNEARKQLIQDGNSKFQNMRFEDVGL